MKLRNLFLMVTLLLPMVVNAGAVLKCKVIADDEPNMVFSFTITQTDSAKSVLTGTVEGKMVVDVPFEGSADVKITSLGYDSYSTRVDLEDGMECDLGTIKLSKNSLKLGEVVVTGKKINVRRDGPDYTISNIQGTHLGNAGSLMDMLTWTPGVIVNQLDKSIDVVGAGSPIIYINNKKVQNKSELDILQSSMVSKIEIIRAPGAEYSSSTAAVIKITTFKPLKDYLGVTLTNTSSMGRRFGNNTRLNVDAKNGIMSGNLSVSYNNDKSKIYGWEKTEILQPDGSMFKTDDSNTKLADSESWNVFAGLNFDLGKKSVLGIQYSGSYRDNKLEGIGVKSYNEGNRIINKKILANSNTNSNDHVASISYVWNRSKNSALTIVADYSNNPTKTFKRSEECNLTDGGAYVTNINTDKKYDIYTFNSDFSFSFMGKDKEKVGLEFYHVNSDAGTSIGDYMQGSMRRDTWFSAFYTFKRKWGKWNVELGLRYEYDRMKNEGRGESSDMSRTYSDLLPTIRGSYRFNNDVNLTAIYRRVISRPGFQELDPTVYYSDSLNYSTGNPLLKPTYTDRYRMILNWKAVSVGVQYWRYNDEVINVLSRKEPGSNIYVAKPENIEKSDAWMLNVDYSLSVNRFNMSLGGGLVLPYMEYPYLDEMRKVNTLFASVNGNFNYMFNIFNNPLIAFAQARYSTQGESGISLKSASNSINVGAQLLLLNNDLKIMVAGFNLLNSSTTSWSETRYGNMYQWHKSRNDNRKLYINISYTFNSLKTKFKGRGGNSKAYERTN